jgi:CheY-like chemotaxis protein
MNTITNPSNSSRLLRNARVLVVDDIPETRENIAAALTLFSKEAIACPPEEAIRAVRHAYPPIDALVTDLRLPPDDKKRDLFVSRFSPPKHGIELLQKLEAHCPPSVVMTGSISSKDLARMQSEAIAEDGTPAARFSLKSAGIGALTRQLEGALADSKRISCDNRAQVISKISEPKFDTEARYERNNAAAISYEKLHNYLKRLNDCLKELKESCDLDNWPSWKQCELLMHCESSYLSTFDSARFLGKKSAETLDALHQVAGHFMLLDPEILIIPDNLAPEARAISQAALQTLSVAYKATSIEINNCFEGFKIKIQGLFSLDEKLLQIFDARFCSGREPRERIFYHKYDLYGTVKIPDPDEEIRNFLRELNTALQPYQASLDIRFSCADYELQDFEIRRDKLNWGSSYRIGVRIYEAYDKGKPTWAYLDSLRYSIEKLSKAKLLYVDKYQFSADADSGLHFEFFIKVSDRDLKAEQAEINRIAQIAVTPLPDFQERTKNRYSAKVNVPSGSFIALDFNPQEIVKQGHNLCAALFDKNIIIASSDRHLFADRLIYYYLRQNYMLSTDKALEIAQNSIRISNNFDDCLVEKSDHLWQPQLESLLKDLGLSTRRPKEGELPPRNFLNGLYTRD